MELAYMSMNTENGTQPAELARALEERGYDSVWFGEHAEIPVRRATPYPAGGELPEAYSHMMDPFVSLMAAAAATTRLRLGTGVCLVLEHDVLALAKTVATLDRLSNGRVIFGVGVGWNVEELANHAPGIKWSQRYRALKERCAALVACWTEEQPAVDGEFTRFEASWVYPKPHQQPHPQITMGAAGRLGMRHAAEWCQGWCPIDVGFREVEKGLARFAAACDAAGKDPAAFEISLYVFGQPEEDKLRRYADLGIHRAVLGGARPDMDDPAATLPFLDRYAKLIPDLKR
ncbi:MAG: TIGR03619 family F420-dependent LLM class oxidoreductase [Acidimicrobiales bacterium]